MIFGGYNENIFVEPSYCMSPQTFVGVEVRDSCHATEGESIHPSLQCMHVHQFICDIGPTRN